MHREFFRCRQKRRVAGIHGYDALAKDISLHFSLIEEAKCAVQNAFDVDLIHRSVFPQSCGDSVHQRTGWLRNQHGFGPSKIVVRAIAVEPSQ